MFTKIHKRMKSQKGFTLIELLVVIIIIAILAAIAIPTFLGQRQKAQDASAKSLVRNAMTAIESAYVDTRSFDPAATVPIDDAMLTAIEPSIVFTEAAGSATTGESADPIDGMEAADDQVGWNGLSASSYEVVTRSQSGKTFGVVVDKGTDGGNDWYINGAVADW